MTDALLPLLVAIPLAAAAVRAAIGPRLPRVARDVSTTLVAVGVAVLAVVLLVRTEHRQVVSWAGGWTPRRGTSVGVVLVADPAAACLVLVTAVLTVAALAYSFQYLPSVGGLYHALVLVFLAGACGFSLAGDLFDMFVFFELMSASAYVLTAYLIEDRGSLQGAVNFAFSNTLGAACTLVGIGLLYARTGELGMAQLGQALDGQQPDALVVGAFVLVCTGWLVKAAAVPFHFWCGDAHAAAPTPVCVLFSGVMDALGVYAVARVYWTVFSGVLAPEDVRGPLLALGALTAVVGAVMCVAQLHLKRLLAFSTVSHIGVFLLGVAVMRPDGIGGLVLYVTAHAGVKGALFMATGVLLNRRGSVNEPDLFGRGRGMTVSFTVYALGGLALAGLPPFGVAVGKGLVEESLTAGGASWAVAVVVVSSAVTGAAVLRAAMRVFTGLGPRPAPDKSSADAEEGETNRPLDRRPWTMLTPALALLGLSLAIGFVPGVADWAVRAGGRLTDRTAYAAAALTGRELPVPVHEHVATHSVTGVAVGLVSVLLAVLIAAGIVFHGSLGRPGRVLARLVLPPVRAVRVLHTGRLGDYTAWLVAGVAALAGAVGLSVR